MAAMPSLTDATEIERRLGRPLTQPEAARVDALLEDASGLVRGYTRRDFRSVDDAEAVLRAQQGEIRLPQRPVRAVSSVVALGAGGAPDLPVVGWQFDGVDLIRVLVDGPVINMPAIWYDEDLTAYPGTYRVVYSYGDAEVDPAVIAVVARMVLRTLTAPTMAGGMTGETIGPYSYRTDGSSIGSAVTMLDEDRTMLNLAGYRPKAGTSMMRWR